MKFYCLYKSNTAGSRFGDLEQEYGGKYSQFGPLECQVSILETLLVPKSLHHILRTLTPELNKHWLLKTKLLKKTLKVVEVLEYFGHKEKFLLNRFLKERAACALLRDLHDGGEVRFKYI